MIRFIQTSLLHMLTHDSKNHEKVNLLRLRTNLFCLKEHLFIPKFHTQDRLQFRSYHTSLPTYDQSYFYRFPRQSDSDCHSNNRADSLVPNKKMFSLNSSQKLYDETGFRILALNILHHNLLVITVIKVPFLPDFIKA